MRKVLLCLLLLAPLAFSQSANTLGTVHLETSCSAAVQPAFNHAVALLHSFEYDEARPAFAAVLKQDPKCAMAAWGVAMTYFHGLWGEYNPEGAKAAAEARSIAKSNPAVTERENLYIAAISEIFTEETIKASQRDDNKPDPKGYLQPEHSAELAYAAKMAELHKQFPQDDEATIFYALALDIAHDRKDSSHANEKQCTALLNPLMAKYPNHPGVAHYLVHCNDNPDMAADGLPAARVYAKIAPASAHATHMPAHIFAQLGLWNEMIASNRLSLKAAEADTDASACQKVGNTLHSMHFLVFALLQKGELQEAKEVLAQAHKVIPSVPGGDKCGDSDSMIIAVFTLETHDWKEAANIKTENDPFGAAITWGTIGIAAANLGDDPRAAEAELALKPVAGAAPGAHARMGHDSGTEVARLTVAAMRAHAGGDKAKGESLMRNAVEMQERMGGSYTVMTPVSEMLADMLLADGKAAEALAQYQAVLKRQPNRFNSLYGAGSAAFAEGDKAMASRYYQQLITQAPGNERKELAVAHERAGSEVAGK